MSRSSRPKSRMIRSPAIGSTRRSLSPLKGAEHLAATMLPNVQVTARGTCALGIFKGAGSAGYRLLGGSRRSAFAVPVWAAEAELPILPATARGEWAGNRWCGFRNIASAGLLDDCPRPLADL